LLYYNLKSLTNNNFPLYLLKADFQNIKFK
jgi:hypothetical protein